MWETAYDIFDRTAVCVVQAVCGLTTCVLCVFFFVYSRFLLFGGHDEGEIAHDRMARPEIYFRGTFNHSERCFYLHLQQCTYLGYSS